MDVDVVSAIHVVSAFRRTIQQADYPRSVRLQADLWPIVCPSTAHVAASA